MERNYRPRVNPRGGCAVKYCRYQNFHHTMILTTTVSDRIILTILVETFSSTMLHFRSDNIRPSQALIRAMAFFPSLLSIRSMAGLRFTGRVFMLWQSEPSRWI